MLFQYCHCRTSSSGQQVHIRTLTLTLLASTYNGDMISPSLLIGSLKGINAKILVESLHPYTCPANCATIVQQAIIITLRSTCDIMLPSQNEGIDHSPPYPPARIIMARHSASIYVPCRLYNKLWVCVDIHAQPTVQPWFNKHL